MFIYLYIFWFWKDPFYTANKSLCVNHQHNIICKRKFGISRPSMYLSCVVLSYFLSYGRILLLYYTGEINNCGKWVSNSYTLRPVLSRCCFKHRTLPLWLLRVKNRVNFVWFHWINGCYFVSMIPRIDRSLLKRICESMYVDVFLK